MFIFSIFILLLAIFSLIWLLLTEYFLKSSRFTSKYCISIVCREAARELLFFTRLRLSSLLSVLLAVIAMGCLFYVASLLWGYKGVIITEPAINGSATQELYFSPDFSLIQLLYGFLATVVAGSVLGFFVHKLGSINRDAYEHLYYKLLPELNHMICRDSAFVRMEMAKNKHSLITENDIGAIRNVLAEMHSFLNSSGYVYSPNWLRKFLDRYWSHYPKVCIRKKHLKS